MAAQDVPVFRVGTDAVLVPVTVTDRSGRFVHGLTRDLAFEPGRADGEFHAIRVRTKDARLRVRARAGYIASSATAK